MDPGINLYEKMKDQQLRGNVALKKIFFESRARIRRKARKSDIWNSDILAYKSGLSLRERRRIKTRRRRPLKHRTLE